MRGYCSSAMAKLLGARSVIVVVVGRGRRVNDGCYACICIVVALDCVQAAGTGIPGSRFLVLGHSCATCAA